jgi:hypothetical protein
MSVLNPVLNCVLNRILNFGGNDGAVGISNA